MNDALPKLPEAFPGPNANPQVIEALEAALRRARAGQVVGVAIIMAHGGDGISTTYGGGCVAALVAGAVKTQGDLTQLLFGERPNGGRQSPILRARPM